MRIDLALSSWESDRIVPSEGLTWRYRYPLVTVAGPWLPVLMAANGPGPEGHAHGSGDRP
jgi:hypothetical protein